MLRRLPLAILLSISFFTGFEAFSQQNSVLSEGQWFKLAVTRDGIYKIDYNFLKAVGIDPDQVNPKKLQIYGNGAGMLPQANDSPRIDDLIQNQVWVSGQEDGKFNSSDYLAFYAQGPDAHFYGSDGALNYQRNVYTDYNYYFLTIGKDDGLRIGEKPNEGLSFQKITHFNDFGYFEKEKFNLLSSGREWYSDKFDLTTSYDYTFTFPGIVANSRVNINSEVMAQSFAESGFTLLVNGNKVGEQNVASVPNFENSSGLNRYSIKGKESIARFAYTTTNTPTDKVIVNITYNKNSSGRAIGYLNNLSVETVRKLELYDNYTFFRSLESTANSQGTFEISSVNSDALVWDVTNPRAPIHQKTILNGTTLSFGASTQTLKEYAVFDPSKIEPPEFIEKIANQNIRAATTTNLIIIAHPDFKSEASRLAAFRTSYDNLSAAVYTTLEVYNEFSSGKPDVTAIRDFIKHQYDKSNSLKYVLLLGKGSYDYKDVNANNTNFVPVYESRNSLHPLYTYASDDYYGFMGDDEGDWREENGGNHTLEIGVGRIPVTTPEEAKGVVDKIINYSADAKTRGPWRNEVVFVADDEDGNVHVDQSNQLSILMDTTFTNFNYKKMYLDAYPQISTPNGVNSPEMVKTLNEVVGQGALIVNFTGHGSESVWMQEQILTLPMIRSWKNKYRLPLFVTATCEFGRHDDPFQTSGGELLVTIKDKGAVAIISTCRPVYSASNFQLNKAFFKEIFTKENNQYLRLGDIIRLTKNNSVNTSIDPNKVGNRNFALLGDPSMMLNYPREEVVITALNNKPLYQDTLKALSKVKISGEILSSNNTKSTNFNGELDIQVFDKESTLITLGNAGNIPFEYKSRENALFRGKTSIENGGFEFEFIVPKNISYKTGTGKISLYATDVNKTTDANGAEISLAIGGTAPNPAKDVTGPTIALYFGDSTYTGNAPVNSNTLLVAKLEDESGINITDYGLANGITAILDDHEPVLLNDYYSAATDTYQRGWVAYPINDLKEGRHTLTLKAWDTYNNSGETTIDFFVSQAGSLNLTTVGSFPNPFRDNTTITFEHNRAGEPLEVNLQILNTSGQVIADARFLIEDSPARVLLYEWNGSNSAGKKLNPGIYLFKVMVRSQLDGAKNQKYQKLILTN